LLQKATDIVSVAKQDPTLAKVVNPIDEKYEKPNKVPLDQHLQNQ